MRLGGVNTLDTAVQIISQLRGIPAAAAFRKWVRAALPRAAHITLRIVNAAEAQQLNRKFRRQDYAANVLTFEYGGTPLAADIVLCAQAVTREAREQGKPLAAHYAHLTVHGVLHAQGFDHLNTRDAQIMEAREIAILSKLGFDNPYET